MNYDYVYQITNVDTLDYFQAGELGRPLKPPAFSPPGTPWMLNSMHNHGAKILVVWVSTVQK